MRIFLLFVSLILFSRSFSQQNCVRNSSLYHFDRSAQPRHFTERLGSHPEFPFLQEVNGVSTTDLFLRSIRNDSVHLKYAREFKAFDLLLRNSGFRNGYKDLSKKNVENVHVSPGTIGNLGFYDKQKDLISYIYVRLNPAGEDASGIAAWKLTNSSGCFLYILHTCGNAFYPNSTECCKAISVETGADSLDIKPDSSRRNVHVRLNFYEARLVVAGQKEKRSAGKYDTIVSLIRHTDTVRAIKEAEGRKLKIYAYGSSGKILVCRDTVIRLNPRLAVDSSTAGVPDSILFIVSDTAYPRPASNPLPLCHKKWEISLDGGISFNSIPRLNSATVHTQTNGGHPAAELAVSRIFNHWFQAGLSASYITLSYQDDIVYPGTVAGTYNTVWIGKPIIPVQLFGKATIGGPLGWQSNISLSAGYSIPMNDKIENGGSTLTTKPSVKGGLTAGLKMGIAYFFSCRFGLGLSVNGQYFSNKATTMSYHLFAMPVTAGIRYRF
ncbi:MAG TPA: hypothetical protein VK563_21075 [Puia sp.]|nr:hypothetical protein [Puia sp.]